MLGQRPRRWANIDTTLGQRLVFVYVSYHSKHDASDVFYCTSVVLLLSQRRRRWTNIKTTPVQMIALVENPALTKWWYKIGPTSKCVINH